MLATRGKDDLKLLRTENWRLREAVISHRGTEAQRREFSVGRGGFAGVERFRQN
jgi:hypothetical protein